MSDCGWQHLERGTRKINNGEAGGKGGPKIVDIQDIIFLDVFLAFHVSLITVQSNTYIFFFQVFYSREFVQKI